MKRRPRLTRARLRELLHYDPETGKFRWRKRTSNGARLDFSAGSAHVQRGYRHVKIDGYVYSEHQLAWFYMTGRWGRPTIDHRDQDVTNNRWSNLRRATASQNNANRRRPRNNSTGYKGVSLRPRSGRFYAQIGWKGQNIRLGTFPTAQAAHAAYLAAARKYHGEFARAE